MAIFIRHRINSRVELGSVEPEMGVEIDLRSDVGNPGAMHLSHDPWRRGEPLEPWLDEFQARRISGPLILNTKEDGLEEALMATMARRGIENFLFLDTAMPTLVYWTRKGLGRKFFLRLSAFENREALRPFEGKQEWLWVDCFDGQPLDSSLVREAGRAFKICLVSPELQKQPVERVGDFRSIYSLAQAVCTKSPDVWRQLGAGQEA